MQRHYVNVKNNCILYLKYKLKPVYTMRKPMVVVVSLLAGMFFLTACQKEYSVEVNRNAAEGSLQDSTGNCLQDSVVGTYYNGVTPGSDTAYIQVKVNVTKPGSYTIYTNKQNGLSFSDSGYFSATGLTTIKLKPTGAPILPGGPFDFNVTFDSTVCYFTLNVKDSTGLNGNNNGGGGSGGSGGITTGLNSWQFTTPAGIFSGHAAATYSNITGYNILTVQGTTGDSSFTIRLQMSSSTPQTGTFTTNGYGPDEFSLYDASSKVIYKAGLGANASDVLITIVISSYDASSKEMKATFSGTAKDVSGNTVNVTDGAFDVTVN